MKKKICYVLLPCLLVFGSIGAVLAGMGSGKYTITKSVLSGGSTKMSSETFQMESTVNQPSPVVEGEPSQSPRYSNSPGLLYPLSGTLPCRQVEDLSARDKSGKVQLTWAHVDADAYDIYRSQTADGDYVRIAEGHVTDYCTYLDTDVSDGSTYYYMVAGVCNETPYIYSNISSATPTSRRRR